MIQIQPNTEAAYRLFHDGTLALARAEQQGMRIDLEYCEKKERHLTRKIHRLEQNFINSKFYRRWAGSMRARPNINSNPQLAYFLYEIEKIPPIKITATGKGATDEEALEKLNLPELNDILEIRKLKKIRDTYLKGFVREQINGQIHPSFNLHTVRTFRSSSDRPNFQNIPKRDKEAKRMIRKAIYPRRGHQLMEIDFGSLEVRIAACYHHDPTMMAYIRDPSTDMHGDMAKQIFKIKDFDKKLPEHALLRGAVKNGFVFPQFYGDYYKNCALYIASNTWCRLPEGRWRKGQGVSMPGGKTISDHLIRQGIKSTDDFVNHIRKIEQDFWGTRFPVYAEWKEEWWREYLKTGSINMLTGFTCYGVMGKNDCINYPVQGSAFHCLLWGFIELDRYFEKNNFKTRLIGQIHDAVIFDVHPDELEKVIEVSRHILIEKLPENWKWICVPLEVEAEVGNVDESLDDLKPFYV